MDEFQRLIVKTVVSMPELMALLQRVDNLEAQFAKSKNVHEPVSGLAISHKELVAQVGGALVRKGEATGILIPIVSNGGKGPKKRYPVDQVTALINTYSQPKDIKNGKS